MKFIDLTQGEEATCLTDDSPARASMTSSSGPPAKRRKLEKKEEVIELLDDSQSRSQNDCEIMDNPEEEEVTRKISMIHATENVVGVTAVKNDLSSSSSSTTSSSASSSSSKGIPLWGERTETDIKQVIAADDDVDEATRVLILQVVAEEEEAREEELRNERLSLSLLEEEREERQKQLDNQRYLCCICLDDEVKLEDMITLSCEPVAHRLCKDCFGGYCESKIREAEVGQDQLVCPTENCKTPISIFEIKSCISVEMFERYERFQMSAFGKESDDCRFCPKCNEWFAEVPQTDEDEVIWRKVLCGSKACQHPFCGRCGQEPHRGQADIDLSCEDFAKWQQQNAKADEDFESFRAKAGIVQCPKCKMGGGLSGGCKFIYCRCGTRYCFLCQVKLEEKHHYSHFQGKTPDGKNCQGAFGTLCKGPEDADLRTSVYKGKGKLPAAPAPAPAPRRQRKMPPKRRGKK